MQDQSQEAHDGPPIPTMESSHCSGLGSTFVKTRTGWTLSHTSATVHLHFMISYICSSALWIYVFFTLNFTVNVYILICILCKFLGNLVLCLLLCLCLVFMLHSNVSLHVVLCMIAYVTNKIRICDTWSAFRDGVSASLPQTGIKRILKPPHFVQQLWWRVYNLSVNVCNM